MTDKYHRERQLQVGASVRRNCATSSRRRRRRRTPTLPDNDAITAATDRTAALPVVTCVVRLIERRCMVRMDRRDRRPQSAMIVAGRDRRDGRSLRPE